MGPKHESARLVELPGEGAARSRTVDLPPSMDSSSDEEPGIAEYLWTVLEHRTLVIVATLATVFLGAAYLFVVAPTYHSDVLIQIQDKTKGIAGLEDLSTMFTDTTPADTEIEIIRSRSVVGAVVDELNLTIDAVPRTFPVIGGAFFRLHEDDDIASAPLGLRSFAWGGERILVQRLEVPDNLVDEKLRLTALPNNRFKVAGAKNQVLVEGEVGKAASGGGIQIFVAELRAEPGTRFRLTKRLRPDVIDDLQTQLKIAEKGKKTGILTVGLDGKDDKKIVAILDSLSRFYLRQNVEQKSAEAAKTLEFLDQQLPELKKNVETAEGALNAYQQKHGTTDLSLETQGLLNRAAEIETSISELELNRSELRTRFTESHPTLVALNEKIGKLRAERNAMNAKMKSLPEQEVDTARLERDVKTATELYFTLLNKTQELRVMKSGTIGYVRIVDNALKPYEPVSPKKGIVLALSLLLGFGMGVVAAFTKKALDQGVHDPSEIEMATGLSIYATVPHSDKVIELANKRAAGTAATFLALEDPSDLAVESLRSLRTALQFALVDASSNIVTMGGPRPSVGKSFLSVNLAHILATAGKRVLLVDGDLRRGHLHKYFGGHRPGGVSEIVSGQMSIADATRKTAEPNLDFIATGKIPPNPSELVGSPRFQAFVSEVSARYDLVLIDTPPILAVTDPALIGRHAGVNLLALRSGKHPMREITTALKRFSDAGVRLHGIVLNDVEVRPGKLSHSYHYQYEYRSATSDD
jgi:tyrosine-protein kinase Etk/Wzc